MHEVYEVDHCTHIFVKRNNKNKDDFFIQCNVVNEDDLETIKAMAKRFGTLTVLPGRALEDPETTVEVTQMVSMMIKEEL
jgi:hypothetical protein